MQTFKRIKVFSVRQAIQDQANRDSEWYNYMTATPKFVPAPRVKWSAGFVNMMKQLRP